jgi:hypothetical protein
MSAALRQALKQVQQEAPKLARSVRTSAGPRYHYVSCSMAGCVVATQPCSPGAPGSCIACGQGRHTHHSPPAAAWLAVREG